MYPKYLTDQRNGETIYLIQNYFNKINNQEVWTTHKSEAHLFKNQEEFDKAVSWLTTRGTYRKDGN